jgi:hypothetical protein
MSLRTRGSGQIRGIIGWAIFAKTRMTFLVTGLFRSQTGSNTQRTGRTRRRSAFEALGLAKL